MKDKLVCLKTMIRLHTTYWTSRITPANLNNKFIVYKLCFR